MKTALIVDTEGVPLLTQVAVINMEGQVVYEATTPEFPSASAWQTNTCSRSKLLTELSQIVSGHDLIFHYAEHDLKILRASYKEVGLAFPEVGIICSCELARKHFPEMKSFSLEHLSQMLHLTVNGKRFDSNQAHCARYDALFAHQLYLEIRRREIADLSQNSVDPFGSSRVDHPFQNHPDFEEVYQPQFRVLEEIIKEIKRDPNHQSKGAIIIGEPGSGKTHLMMRLAQQLRSNRLFFIRQPNNADSVQYHMYGRVLESLLEKVPGSTFTQLEYLLANTLTQIVLKSDLAPQRMREVFKEFEDNPLDLFTRMGADDTERKQKNWETIERETLNWWQDIYGRAGFAHEIIRGFIKYCRYTQPYKRKLVMQWLAANTLEPEDLKQIGLPAWSEEIAQEEFALEAIGAISKLSLLDEPLIVVFDQLEALFLGHNQEILLRLGESLKEVFTHNANCLIILNLFPDRWEKFQTIFDASIVDRVSQYQVVLDRPDDQQLRRLLAKIAKDSGFNLNELFTDKEMSRVLDAASIRAVINRAGDYYRYKFKNIPLPSSFRLSDGEAKSTTRQGPEDISATLRHIQHQLQKICEHLSINAESVSESSADAPAKPEWDLDIDESSKSFKAFSNSESLPEKTSEIKSYLRTKRQNLRSSYKAACIISDSDDVGKLWSVAQAFHTVWGPLDLQILTFGRKKVPENILCTIGGKKTCIGFCNTESGASFTARIGNWNQLVIQNPDISFRLYRDVRQKAVTGKEGAREIEKLNNSKNGRFHVLEESERIDFELAYALITDVNNRDLEADMLASLRVLESELSNCFVFTVFRA